MYVYTVHCRQRLIIRLSDFIKIKRIGKILNKISTWVIQQYILYLHNMVWDSESPHPCTKRQTHQDKPYNIHFHIHTEGSFC